MKIEYITNFGADLVSLNAAIKSINLPEFSHVIGSSQAISNGQVEHKVLVYFNTDAELSEEKRSAVDKLVLGCSANWDSVRKLRSGMFFEVDWRIQRAQDNGEDVALLIEYRRALRDITKQESPDTVVWPTKPW